MCTDFKLVDTVALQNRLSASFALVASQDNRYCIVVEDGLYTLQLCGLMDNNSACLSLKKLFTKVKDFALSSHLGIDINSFITELPQFELYEAVLRLDISEELNQSTPVKQQPVQAKWSPLGVVGNGQCALAAITNTGAVNIFVRSVNEVELEEFIAVANVSKLCANFFKSSWADVEYLSPSVKLEELKRRAEETTPSAFTWSHLFSYGDKKFCLLIVGHLNGGVTVWRFDSRRFNDVDEHGIGIICCHNVGLMKITTLNWQQAGKNSGLLIVGDLEGRLKAVSVTVASPESVSFGNEISLWNQPDGIKVETITVLVYNELIHILTVKGSFLLICLLNDSGSILDTQSFHVGNYQITGIEHYKENIVLILTYTGVLKEVRLVYEESKLQIDWRPLYIDFKWSSYRTHGLILSPNRVFCAILVSMSKLKDVRKRKDPIRLLIFMNMGKDPLAVLMKNNTESLMSYWDCLEILRLDGLIEKKLPCDGIPPGLDYDKLSLLQLKTCLWLARSSEMMYDKMYSIEDYNILRYDEFKYIVKIKTAMDHMHHLLELLADGVELSEFHMQSLDVLNMYLKELVVADLIPQLGLGKNTIDELFDLISTANDLKYPPPAKCMWCKENIIGLMCLPPHPDSRCCITYMPLTGLPYYKCTFCECTGHDKLNEVYDIVLCSYCDVPMDFVSRLTPSNGETENLREDTGTQIDASCCGIDCVKEAIELDEIEDHAFVGSESVDLLQLSSSDEGDGNTGDVDISSGTESQELSTATVENSETFTTENDRGNESKT